ncbi:hypothetical protein CBR_g19667 [Chara braunii]|uniref:RRM domain-containing protein n=1 Tax=Chara braunii TaxID=69332 RepID=A0A388KYL7_CHABU|nr:hypothetical protein CBR_g19667 [Chara braunii]|eukprot:GBG75154.1 hypothetical protein CBR_g19667 [Chara braunii]
MVDAQRALLDELMGTGMGKKDVFGELFGNGGQGKGAVTSSLFTNNPFRRDAVAGDAGDSSKKRRRHGAAESSDCGEARSLSKKKGAKTTDECVHPSAEGEEVEIGGTKKEKRKRRKKTSAAFEDGLENSDDRENRKQEENEDVIEGKEERKTLKKKHKKKRHGAKEDGDGEGKNDPPPPPPPQTEDGEGEEETKLARKKSSDREQRREGSGEGCDGGAQETPYKRERERTSTPRAGQKGDDEDSPREKKRSRGNNKANRVLLGDEEESDDEDKVEQGRGLRGDDAKTRVVVYDSEEEERQERKKRAKQKKQYDDPEDKLARTVFVGNLPKAVDSKELAKEFSVYGAVESLRFRSIALAEGKKFIRGAIFKGKVSDVHDTQNAYVVFKQLESAKAALAHNMKVLRGNHIRVDAATAPSWAVHQKKGKPLDAATGRRVEYDRNLSIFVGNLPYDVKDEELYQFFGGEEAKPELRGQVAAVRVVREEHASRGKGVAYVLFKTSQAARAALNSRGFKLRERELRIARPSRTSAAADTLSRKTAKLPAVSKGYEMRQALKHVLEQSRRAKPSAFEGQRAKKVDGLPGKRALNAVAQKAGRRQSGGPGGRVGGRFSKGSKGSSRGPAKRAER